MAFCVVVVIRGRKHLVNLVLLRVGEVHALVVDDLGLAFDVVNVALLLQIVLDRLAHITHLSKLMVAC